ncbi:uncharacterized protein TNCV_3199091 [Trichonephila clavipes]|nr:uncharacterized protein TNCV_3199091 [Trichonephila clavipes]
MIREDTRYMIRDDTRYMIRLEIQYKSTLVRNPRYSRRRRIDEADIRIPVAVDQLDVHCLEEAARSCTTLRRRCLSPRLDVTFRRPLPDFRIVRFSSIHFFEIRFDMLNC